MARFVFVVMVTSMAIVTTRAYNTCDPSLLAYKFDGYTYSLDVDTGEKLWSHCAFPSPINDFRLCGWPDPNTEKYVCDPDALLQYSQVAEINNEVNIIQTKTDTTCTDSRGRSQSFIVAVALINRIRIPDLDNSALCINDCGLLYPVIDYSSNSTYPSDAQQTEIMANFAHNIREDWGMGSCGNDVIILYCQEFNRVYISRGAHTSKYLSDDKINSLTAKFSEYLSSGPTDVALHNGIKYLLSQIKTSLRGITYALKLIYACLAVILLVAGLCVLYIIIRETQNDIWGRERFLKLSEWAFLSLTGIYVIEGLIFLMIHLSYRGSHLGLVGVLFVVLLLCIVGHYIGREVLNIQPY